MSRAIVGLMSGQIPIGLRLFAYDQLALGFVDEEVGPMQRSLEPFALLALRLEY